MSSDGRSWRTTDWRDWAIADWLGRHQPGAVPALWAMRRAAEESHYAAIVRGDPGSWRYLGLMEYGAAFADGDHRPPAAP